MISYWHDTIVHLSDAVHCGTVLGGSKLYCHIPSMAQLALPIHFFKTLFAVGCII